MAGDEDARGRRRRRRAEFLRELAELRSLRARVAPRRSRLARERELFLIHTYRR